MQHDGAMCFEALLHSPRMLRMQQHIVRGRPLLPAAAFVEVMLSTLRCVGPLQCRALVGVQITAPLLLNGKGCMQCMLWPQTGKLVVRSTPSSEHATAHAVLTPDAPSTTHSCLLFLDARPNHAATASVAAEMESHTDAFLLHPARLDASLQLGAVGRPNLRVPVGMGLVEARHPQHPSHRDVHAACLVGDASLNLRAAGWRLNEVALHTIMATGHPVNAELLTVLIDEVQDPAAAELHSPPPSLVVNNAGVLDTAAAVLQVTKELTSSSWAGCSTPLIAMLRCMHTEGRRVNNRAAALGLLTMDGDAVPTGGNGLYGQRSMYPVQLQQRYAPLAAPLAGDVHIVAEPKGTLSGLVAQPVSSTSPNTGNTMMHIDAVGVNFRDLLIVMVCALMNAFCNSAGPTVFNTGAVPRQCR